MSNTPTKKTTTAAGTNAANQTVTHSQPYVKKVDLVVIATAQNGSKTTLVLGTDYTVADNAGGGTVKTGGVITLINTLPMTSTVSIAHNYPVDASNDILQRWYEEGCPIDGELATDDRGASALQTSQKRLNTLKTRSTASNP